VTWTELLDGDGEYEEQGKRAQSAERTQARPREARARN
jgi:hypothetical protein